MLVTHFPGNTRISAFLFFGLLWYFCATTMSVTAATFITQVSGIGNDAAQQRGKAVRISRIELGPAKSTNRERTFPLQVHLATTESTIQSGVLLFDAGRMQTRQIPFSVKDSTTLVISLSSRDLQILIGRRAGLSCICGGDMSDSRFFRLDPEMAMRSLFADERLPQNAAVLAQMWNDLRENAHWYTLLSGDTLEVIEKTAAAAWPAAAADNWPQLLTALTQGLGSIIEACKPFKQDTLHLIPAPLFSRTDPISSNSLQRILQILDQFPQIKLAQDDLFLLRRLQNGDPEVFDLLRGWARERRLEWIGAPWGADLAPEEGGDDLLRQFAFSMDYLQQQLGTKAVLGKSSTAPAFLPALISSDSYAGWIHSIADSGKTLSTWKAADYSRLDLITIRAEDNLPPLHDIAGTIRNAQRQGIRHFPLTFSLSRGPVDSTLQKLDKMINLLAFPAVKFDSWSGFLATIRRPGKTAAQTVQRPVFHGALQPPSTPGQTGNALISHQQKRLRDAETLCIMADLPVDATLQQAWISLFDEMHGTAPPTLQLDSLLEPIVTAALAKIASTHPARGKGTPLLVVNTLPWTRTALVSLNARQFPAFDVIADSANHSMDFQRSGDQIIFTAEAVPSLGYTTFWLKSGKSKPPVSGINVSEMVIENDSLKIEINPGNGQLRTVLDKSRQLSLLPGGREALKIVAVANGSTTNPRLSPERVESISIVEPGPLRAAVQHVRTSEAARLVQEVRLTADAPHVDIHLSGEWQGAVEGLDVTIPLLRPFISAWHGSCFGIEKMELAHGEKRLFFIEEAFQGGTADAGALLLAVGAPVWCTLSDDELVLHVRQRTRQGAEVTPFDFAFTLIFTAAPGDLQGALQRTRSLQVPLTSVQPSWNSKEKGIQSTSLLRCDGKDVILQTVKPARDGNGMVLRLTALTDESRRVKISGPLLSRFKKAYLTNPLETKKEAFLFDKNLNVELKPFALVTLVLE